MGDTRVWLAVAIMLMAPVSGCLSSKDGGGGTAEDNWVDPGKEIEDSNHSHNDLLAHRLSTSNAKLIDNHNQNCDGEV